ncbi:unnamed protein product [Durusdinium trenchii]|uniref:Uncharacterized protein n=1 Tax=Durusdinium trenchii TaxID=1381693 RepID=A0ABP0NBY7_9DINO
MQNMPAGNLELVKEIFDYVKSFRDESVDPDAHPASFILEILAHSDDSSRALHCQQLATWYGEYAAWRGKAYLFKGPGQDP